MGTKHCKPSREVCPENEVLALTQRTTTLELPSINQTIHLLERDSLQAIMHVLSYLIAGTGWLKSGASQSAIFLNTSFLDTNEFAMRPGGAPTGTVKPEERPDAEILIECSCMLGAKSALGKAPRA
ncbi:hypothetical protein F5B19DRAFT_242077 [Rostrohypoxylon terebratum]|nr:hypothetical protein F5B19DRAFT_242077 [Rostrohypoxylon terebratum]